ncbi:hypothetical protein [Nocardia jiangxiensis]|uniref:Uncharacterized protein n=1 Tax=Nocardia jiangxiensis TaxID=282685 RepID=A0ABW6RSK5_9NOCA|nr:hypothetical protein [Nocardia jiangxiensis]
MAEVGICTTGAEHYDLELFQVASHGQKWITAVVRTRYWAITRGQISGFVRTAGLESPSWHMPDKTGFFQPVLTAHKP